MSYFLGSTGQYAHVEVNPEKIKLAEVQFTVMASTFNSVLSRCREKCIVPEYGEGDLATGEQSCVDRCVAKYVKANANIAQHVQFMMLPDQMPEYKKVEAMMRDCK
ncbi:hypothetical protein PUMCH_001533 [Australozyma saopauloensis]|uniref:Mitochondrial import inner membrane translocase subunit n=1 Tax=Australozyma saopauloensis TaxID=291208 RepID=A0AAX4H6R6_9ASCO|nr:hypothetical protein PUMCH_001533 [[Candida] saopauloensis]